MLRCQVPIKEYSGDMSISNKAGNIHKITHGLGGWELANTPDNPAYVPLEAEPCSSIQGIIITDIGTQFFEEVRD
ncbi:hypothetical protein O181_067295 [Austropuccinia psidii MF-1]|uniref:Uncharacterized protein n=1 Tax=Austropuccinia psidii MF-1 TaxID=1389203 RepID=A0A9Q3EQI4_9BASI|nr:hypothetical protein [Austropuccinia psidii MF-1]